MAICAVSGLSLEAVATRLAEVNLALAVSPLPGSVSVSVSVGLAQLQTGDTPASLVDRADAELYRTRREARLG